MKSYTDLEQSRKLAEFLPLESADMFWQSNLNGSDRQYLLDMGIEEYFDIEMNFEHYSIGDYDIPAWSLVALLGVLPAECECMSLEHINYGNNHKKYFMSYVGGKNTDTYDNPVDACVDMIEKLNKLNLL